MPIKTSNHGEVAEPRFPHFRPIDDQGWSGGEEFGGGEPPQTPPSSGNRRSTALAVAFAVVVGGLAGSGATWAAMAMNREVCPPAPAKVGEPAPAGEHPPELPADGSLMLPLRPELATAQAPGQDRSRTVRLRQMKRPPSAVGEEATIDSLVALATPSGTARGGPGPCAQANRCSTDDVAAAQARLQAAYEAAARKGAPPAELQEYRRQWDRLAEQSQADPNVTVAGYVQLERLLNEIAPP